MSDLTTKLLHGPESGAPSLLVIATGAPMVIPIAPSKDIRIGRASNADVAIDDASLSRLHATFRLREGAIEVEDLGSSNGTTLRGSRLTPGTSVRLSVGDAVHLGSVLVVIQMRAGDLAERLRPAATAAPSDDLVGRIAASSISVLLLGETGVGKEVMAERIHAASPRAHKPLVKLNCAALMSSVLESELFGHERGSFTGAVKDKPGLVESADEGTLFLDEIGEADPGVQVKLLRVLEARETQRIGALRPRLVDVRFIAATNRIPADQIAAGLLRQDLFYRLAGFTITVPPLRERKDQIPTIVADLLARHRGYEIASDALALLATHSWPGNVRELRNVLDRAVVLAEHQRLTAAVIRQSLQAEPQGMSPPATPSSSDPERARVLAALDECGGNQSMAAEKLGLSRRSLVYRLQQWGMTKPRRR